MARTLGIGVVCLAVSWAGTGAAQADHADGDDEVGREAEPDPEGDAETDAEVDAETEPATAAPPRPADVPRAMPDYDGRPPPSPSVEETLLWIPRIALAPLHLVFEYLLRQPIGALLSWVERESLHFLLIDFFTWNERGGGLVPTAFYDFGLMPSVGLYFFWNDVGAPGHQIPAHVGFGGEDWLQASIWDRVLLSSRGQVELTLEVEGSRRPDRVYQGLGALSDQDDRARFLRSGVEGAVPIATERRPKPERRSGQRLISTPSNSRPVASMAWTLIVSPSIPM